MPGPPESPAYSTEGQTEQAYPPSLFSQQQIFSSLAILKDAPTSVIARSNLPSASPIPEFEAFSNEHMDEAEVAAILLENKTVGFVPAIIFYGDTLVRGLTLNNLDENSMECSARIIRCYQRI